MEDLDFDEKILMKYWRLIGLEHVCGFNNASERDKQALAKTLGYKRYVLQIEVNELAKSIYSALPKFLRKLFRYRSEDEDD